jgi:hypothetical protein
MFNSVVFVPASQFHCCHEKVIIVHTQVDEHDYVLIKLYLKT